jgi:hypothetical protein
MRNHPLDMQKTHNCEQDGGGQAYPAIKQIIAAIEAVQAVSRKVTLSGMIKCTAASLSQIQTNIAAVFRQERLDFHNESYIG